MVSQKDYAIIAEEIVYEILKKKYKTKIHDNRNNPKKIGDFQVGKKIIEVKGEGEDYHGFKNNKSDFVARYITVSKTEWKFLNKFPDRFEIYIVYRLNEKYYPLHPEWNYPKIVMIRGRELVKCKTEKPIVNIKTPKPFWKTKSKVQHPVPKSIWKKYSKKQVI